MVNLQIFFDGLFLDYRITYPRLVNFAQDHSSSMSNNNPGHIYDDAITATNAAALNLETLISVKSGAKGARKGGTEAKNIARVNAEVYIGNKIGWCRSLFGGKKDPRFIETFPQLMNAFYPVSDQIFEENLTTLISKAHLYASVLGPEFEDDLTALKEDYVNSITKHEDQNTEVRTDIVTVQMAADVLSDQLTDNVLLVARHNRRSLTAAILYFNVALLYPAKRKEFYKRTIPAKTEADICNIIYEPGKIIVITNTGAVKLTFGMKLAGDKVGQTVTLEHGENSVQRFYYYFTNGTSLYVINDETTKGMFRLDIKPAE